jgi:hypothetical protein
MQLNYTAEAQAVAAACAARWCLPPVTTATVDWSHHLFSMANVLLPNALRRLRGETSPDQQASISNSRCCSTSDCVLWRQAVSST